MRQKAEPNFVTYSQVFKGKNNCACSDFFEYNESTRKNCPRSDESRTEEFRPHVYL